MLNKIPSYLKNKYIIILLLFLVWICFFDRHNLLSQFRNNKKLTKTEEDKEYYKKQIEKDAKALEELTSDEKNLEKFAREKYRMKKDDEDIFVVLKPEE